MSRPYRPGDAYIKSFSVGATNADALPTAALLRNGAVDGAVAVTITNIEAGVYRAAGTIPETYAIGDVVELRITATLDAAPDKAIVDSIRLVESPGAIFDYVTEGTTTFVEVIRGWTAALMGKASGLNTNAPKYRDLADTKNRIAATTDASGNRTTVTRDLS